MDLNRRMDWSITNWRKNMGIKEESELRAELSELTDMSSEMLEELEYLYHSHELLTGTVQLYDKNGTIPAGWFDRIKEHTNGS